MLLCVAAMAPLLASAQSSGQPVNVTGASTSAPVIDLVDGEIVKVDTRAGKVTLRHGGVALLGVRGGTNAWPVRDRKALDTARPGDQVRFRAERLNGAIVLTELVAAAKPSPELIEVQWDGAGQFLQALAVAPSRFVEVCGKLAKGQTVAWSFSGPAPLDFNIHYHAGSSVSYPARQEGVAALTGSLIAPLAQDYCWMWENHGAQTVALALSLTKAKSAD